VILFRDDHLLIVNKPSGLLVHRGGWGGDEDEAAVQVVRDLCGRFVFPVHRLDRGASGALVFALDAEIARVMHEAFERGEVEKRYVAIVRGRPRAEAGIIDHAIPRREDGPRVPAVTEWRRLAVGEHEELACAVVEARPRSGRLHQVRRHLKHISHPIIGDANYGKGAVNRAFRAAVGLERLALHAVGIGFVHPISGAKMEVKAPIPADLEGPMTRLCGKIDP
jgi:tRNA pseudouridine65 synthase